MGRTVIEAIKEARLLGAEFRLTEEGMVMVRRLSLLPEELRIVLKEQRPEVSRCLNAESHDKDAPIIWKGTVQEYRSLLVVREAELVAAKAQLTGNDRADWYVRNRIHDLEIKVADLRKWLAKAMEKKTFPDTRQEEDE